MHGQLHRHLTGRDVMSIKAMRAKASGAICELRHGLRERFCAEQSAFTQPSRGADSAEKAERIPRKKRSRIRGQAEQSAFTQFFRKCDYMMQGYTLQLLEERIGYRFHDISLLKQALTHSSYTNEQKINKQKHYERLEFLGDAVLEMISSEFLFRTHPQVPEGELTKMRASMVCEPSLAFCAKDLEIGKFLLLGKGEETTGGRKRDSIVSDVMEAVIGAIYLDGGLECAKAFIDRFILSDLEHKSLFYDSKTTLQELVQGTMKQDIHYESAGEYGPEHDKTFRVEAYVGCQRVGIGEGRTKKAAEQMAAYEALLLLKNKRHQEDTCI